MPLYHFATTDLPADTIAPEMSDSNTARSLVADAHKFTGEDLSAGTSVDEDIIGRYLAYLVGVGFLPAPGIGKRELPSMTISAEQKAALLRVGGRGALV